jgi:hypothetical protein
MVFVKLHLFYRTQGEGVVARSEGNAAISASMAAVTRRQRAAHRFSHVFEKAFVRRVSLRICIGMVRFRRSAIEVHRRSGSLEWK